MTDHAPSPLRSLLTQIDALLQEMIDLQRAKVLEMARATVPHLTTEDVLTPEAYPALYADGPFNYEDGVVNGLLSAQTAVRALFRRSER